MRVVSVNTGLPREVAWHGTNVTTGIYKQPVEGRVALRLRVMSFELEDERHQGLGDEPPAVEAKMAALVGARSERIELGRDAHVLLIALTPTLPSPASGGG